MTTQKTPGVSVLFRPQKAALETSKRVLILGVLGSDIASEDVPAGPFKVLSEADTGVRVGDSDINEAVKLWFSSPLSQAYELYVLGYDADGFTPNTWTVTVAPVAATQAAGTLNFRYGSYHVPVSVAKSANQDAIATAIADAINASSAPVTAVVNGTNANQVDLTSEYVGLHTQRYPVSFDLYRDRGETGVDGVTIDVVNGFTGAGEPTFDAAPLKDELFDWYLSAQQGTAWLDALALHLQAGWDERNNFGIAITGVSGTQSELTTLGDARNDAHTLYAPTVNAPTSELSGAVAYLDAIVRQQREQAKVNISGQAMLIPLLPTFTTKVDSEALLDAGVTAVKSQRALVYAVRTVVNRRLSPDGAEDLRHYDIGAILSLRDMGERLLSWANLQLGKAIVGEATPVTPEIAASTTSPNRLLATVREVFKGLWRDGIVYAESEADLESAVVAITPVESGGVLTGFDLVFEPELVRSIVLLNMFVRYN